MLDVVIVGCGPVGAILANLLGKDGFSVVVLDQARDIYDKPRAINIDHEVLRTCQVFGLADAVQEGTVPHTGTDFRGAEGEIIKILNSVPPPHPMAWPPNLMFVQPKMEAVLRRGLARYPSIDLRVAQRVDSVEAGEDHVVVRVRPDEGEAYVLEARYVVACDGGASRIRKQLGITQTSLNFDEWYVVVDALLQREADLPARTTHFCRPTGPGTYVVGPGPLRRFEMKLMPGDDPAAFGDGERVRTKLAQFVDVSAFEIWRSAAYRFHALVADRWRVGRVLLAGDSAHQMPPHMGQGLCSGVRDAVNLSWKLKLVLRELSPDALLDTYQAERRPHIATLVALSKDIAAMTGELDPAKAAVRDRTLREELESGRAVTVRQNLIPGLSTGLIDPARSALSGTLSVQPEVLCESVDGLVLLDELIGESFAVIGLDIDPLVALRPETARELERLGARPLTIASPGGTDCGVRETGSLFRDWMNAAGARIAIVRPDRFVYGSAAGPDEAERLASALCDALVPREKPHRPRRQAEPARPASTLA